MAAACVELADRLLGELIYCYPDRSVHGARAVARRNVHAVGVGEKLTGRQPTGQACLRIHVGQKLPPSLIPPDCVLPSAFRGIPTDVVESPISAIQPPQMPDRKRPKPGTCSADSSGIVRPVIGGVSFASRRIQGGTLACFCRSTRAGEGNQVYALTAGHVLGSIAGGTRGDPVLQPAPTNFGRITDRIGCVDRMIRIQPCDHARNLVDAGIAAIDPAIAVNREVCSIGAISGVREAELKLAVVKHGATSGLTPGVVTDISLSALVDLGKRGAPILARFDNQLRIESTDGWMFSQGGDSGSLIVDPIKNEAVGLLFAGPDDDIYAYANPIGEVLKALDIELL